MNNLSVEAIKEKKELEKVPDPYNLRDEVSKIVADVCYSSSHTRPSEMFISLDDASDTLPNELTLLLTKTMEKHERSST